MLEMYISYQPFSLNQHYAIVDKDKRGFVETSFFKTADFYEDALSICQAKGVKKIKVVSPKSFVDYQKRKFELTRLDKFGANNNEIIVEVTENE